MKKLPQEQFRQSLTFFVAVSILIAGLVLYFGECSNDIVLVQLVYKATCLAIAAADLSTNLVRGGCFAEGEITQLTLLAWIPTFSGMGAVACAAAFAYGNAGGLPALNDPEWRAVVDQRAKALQHSVYVLSSVLVSSTITTSVFAHLPMGLLKTDDAGLADAVTRYVVGLSTFWGRCFRSR